MTRRPYLGLLTILLLAIITPPFAQAQDERPLLLTHYMAWYQTPEVSGYWGWHWTMDHFDPSKGEKASHYMPLTGLYDSQDDALLEYQVLLMKLSGIDGVIVDWYGPEDALDYAPINAATGKLFEYIKKAGLKFAICYEDRSVDRMVVENYIERDESYAHGQIAMNYVEDQWFGDEAYLRYQDQPLLFIWGPHYFKAPEDWEILLSELETPPALVTLDGFLDWAFLSSYPWPPMGMAVNGEVSRETLQKYLESYYREVQKKDFIVGGAFPSFHDIYKEADVQNSYGYLDAQDGATFQYTLDMALANNVDAIQLVTWNDYGEGTMIEPTEETGYQYLEIVQATRQALSGADFTFTPDDLRLPLQVFQLRKEHAGDAEIQAQLDDVFDAIIAGDLATAATLLNTITENE